ncbi:MAG: DinB family protein [Actinomycetota bacterium]
MTASPSRPTTDVSVVILDSMDRMFGQLLERLEGLTNEEYLWEPVSGSWSARRRSDGRVVVDGAGERDIDPAPITTIAWRLWHIAIDCFDDYSRRFGGDPSDAPETWTLDAAEATETLRERWNSYRSLIGRRNWWDQLGPNWEHWSQHSVADMAMHASNELVHHAAEIALLRDLYRASFAPPNFEGATLFRTSFKGAAMRGCDVSGVTMRSADTDGLDIDGQDLLFGSLCVCGVDVVPLVDAELNRQFPGRELQGSQTPAGLRDGWVAAQAAWSTTVADTPIELVDAHVDHEWSLAQTLRHLVLTTDAWLRLAVLRIEQPFHEIGLMFSSAAEMGFDMSSFRTDVPSLDEVLAARAERQQMVTDFLAEATPELLAEERDNPWGVEGWHPTVGDCVRVILEEEWAHLRYIRRDLALLA